MTTEFDAAEIDYESVRLAYPNSDFGLDVNLRIPRGEVIGILGRSGSGKSTAIKIAAGLIRNRESQRRLFRLGSPSVFHTGRFIINGTDSSSVEPAQRHGFLISQHSNLYPHLSVKDNLLLIDKHAFAGKAVTDSLKELDVIHTLDRFPSQTSGGESQRIALVKAMIAKSSFILFDEALSALDQDLKIELLKVLRCFHDKRPCTYIFVTHDQDSLMSFADRIAVLDKGRILQFASPEVLLTAPLHRVVAGTLDPYFRVPLEQVQNRENGFEAGQVLFRGRQLPEAVCSAVINTRMLTDSLAKIDGAWVVTIQNARSGFIGGQSVVQVCPQGSNREWTLSWPQKNILTASAAAITSTNYSPLSKNINQLLLPC